MLRVVSTIVLVPQPVLDIVSGRVLFHHMFRCYYLSNNVHMSLSNMRGYYHS